MAGDLGNDCDRHTLLYELCYGSVPECMGAALGDSRLSAEFLENPRYAVSIIFFIEKDGQAGSAGIVKGNDPPLVTFTDNGDKLTVWTYASGAEVAKFLHSNPGISEKSNHHTLLFGSRIEDFPILNFRKDSLIKRLIAKIFYLFRYVFNIVIGFQILKKAFYGGKFGVS